MLKKWHMLKLVSRVLTFVQAQNRFPRSKTAIFTEIISDYDLIVTSRTPYHAYPKQMINSAKFDVCTPGSIGEVKTDRYTY